MLANRSATINIVNLSDSALGTSPLQLAYSRIKFPKLGTDYPLASVSVPSWARWARPPVLRMAAGSSEPRGASPGPALQRRGAGKLSEPVSKHS